MSTYIEHFKEVYRRTLEEHFQRHREQGTSHTCVIQGKVDPVILQRCHSEAYQSVQRNYDCDLDHEEMSMIAADVVVDTVAGFLWSNDDY